MTFYCMQLHNKQTLLDCAQTPPSYEEKGLVTIKLFLGCVELVVSMK